MTQQAPITASFASPDDIYFDLFELLATIVLVVFLVIVTVVPYLVLKSLRSPARRTWDGLRQWRPVLPTPAFTSELVHKALEELVRARKERRAPRPWLHFAVVVALGAALMTLVDGRVMTDGLGLGVQILGLVAAYALAAAVIVAAYLGIAHRLEHRGNPLVTLHGFLWLREAIVLAVALAMITYWWEFNPGYVYGVLGFFTIVRHGADTRAQPVRMAAEGIAIMVAAWVTTAIAIAAWFFWEGLDHAAERTATADATGLDLLVGVFVLVVLEAVVFALLPIPMLDGAKLFNWNRAMWALTFIPIAGFFVHLLFTETAGPLDWGEAGMMLGLFALFGALSTLMWYVVWRRIQAEQQAYDHAGAAE
ncbi:FGLLP motif-containing membrane protein [Nonomuraea polychroma]|uniref:FGLLP motif-containing membrane protein n=1 Tax=Nonomuraea polychroma TaxID=46176 RepID=UPI003D8C5DB8